MILLAGTGWVLIAAFLILALLGHPSHVPAPAWPALRWLQGGVLLAETGALLGLIAHQHDWAQIHRAIGAVVLLFSLTALACLAAAAISWRRQNRIMPGQASRSPGA